MYLPIYLYLAYIYIYMAPRPGAIGENRVFGGMLWVLIEGFILSYYNKEAILFTVDPYYGNLT